MKVKLTTLCENTASGPGIAAEWGWSIFVETDDINILYDTGGGIAAVRNADTLGIDLKAAMKLAEAFGDRFFFNNAGSVCTIE